MTKARQDWEHHAGSISNRNGAWLISVSDPEGEATPDEEFDVASNQPLARRIAREMAERWGFRGPWRWKQDVNHRGLWWLEGTPADLVEEDEDA